MPISKEEFEKGRKIPPLERTVVNFLQAHRNQAYSESEISNSLRLVRGTNFFSDVIGALTLSGVLNTLAVEGRVTKKTVGDTEYYRFAK